MAAGHLTSTTAVNWHLKVEDIEYSVCTTNTMFVQPKMIASQSAYKKSAQFIHSFSRF